MSTQQLILADNPMKCSARAALMESLKLHPNRILLETYLDVNATYNSCMSDAESMEDFLDKKNLKHLYGHCVV